MTKKKFQNGNFLHIFLFQAPDTIGQHCTSRQERYQALRGVAIFPEDLGSVPITLMKPHNCHSSSRKADALF